MSVSKLTLLYVTLVVKTLVKKYMEAYLTLYHGVLYVLYLLFCFGHQVEGLRDKSAS